MKKVVLKLDLHDEKSKQKAMKTVSGLSGVDSIVMDMKDKKLTVTGDVDPVTVVGKLKKMCHTEIVSVGPAKEPEKKKEEGPKKDDQGNKKDDNNKKEEPKKDDKAKAQALTAHIPYPPPQYQYYQQPYDYNYHQQQQQTQVPSHYYQQRVVEDENPNACVIC